MSRKGTQAANRWRKAEYKARAEKTKPKNARKKLSTLTYQEEEKLLEERSAHRRRAARAERSTAGHHRQNRGMRGPTAPVEDTSEKG